MFFDSALMHIKSAELINYFTKFEQSSKARKKSLPAVELMRIKDFVFKLFKLYFFLTFTAGISLSGLL